MKWKSLIGKQTALQASVALVAMALISKILGLGRVMLVARTLGSSAQYDLYLTVYMLPAAITTTITYTVSKAVTPYYQRARVEYGDEKASRYAWRITLIGSACFLLLATVCAIAAPVITRYLLPTADSQQLETAASMFRVLIFMPVLFFWFASIGAFLQAERYFIASSVGIVLQNVCMIGGLWLLRDLGAWALLWSWVGALAVKSVWNTSVHLATNHPLAPKHFALDRFPRPYVTGLLLATVQIIFVELWTQLWTVTDRFLAQYLALADGTIASLTYANTVYVIPLSMFNVGIGRVAFPLLSGYVAANKPQQTWRVVRYGLHSVCVILIPIMVYMILQGEIVVAALYQRGAFDAKAVATTASALRWLVLVLPFEGTYIILGALLYARRDFRTLILSAVAGAAVKFAASYGLTSVLAMQGLVLATCLASLARLIVITSRLSLGHMAADLATLLAKVFGASLVAGGLTWLVTRLLFENGRISSALSWSDSLVQVILGLPLFIIVYIAMSLALNIAEFRQALRWVKTKTATLVHT